MAINGQCNNKASLGGKSAGPNPTDSSKSGNKRSMLVESQDILFGIKKRKEGCQNTEQEDGQLRVYTHG